MGRTATITYWRKNYEPVSFLDVIAENLARGAHTLCLMDIDAQMGCMKPSLALEIIENAQEKRKKEKEEESGTLLPVLSSSTPLFVLWHVGWADQRVWAGTGGEYPYGPGKKEEEPAGPAVILIPGRMHFSEEEAWQAARGARG